MLSLTAAGTAGAGDPGGHAVAGPDAQGELAAASLVDTVLLRSESLSWWSAGGPEGSDGVDLLEILMREAAALRENPLDLNSVSAADLCRIPGLEASDAVAIVRAREAGGPFARVEDLAVRVFLDRRLVDAIRPYVVCRLSVESASVPPGAWVCDSPTASALEWSAQFKTSWEVDPADEWSAEKPSDVVPASHTFARLRARAGRGWSAGIGVERDPWELRCVDHVAFHVSRRPERRAPRERELSLTAGDLIIDWGQGLLAGGGGFGDVRRFPRSSDRVRGYDGAAECVARRGLHVGLSRGVIATDALCANTRLDAGLDDQGLVSSIRASGLHRTPGERSGRGRLLERLAAARVRLRRSDSFSLGVSALSIAYAPGLARGDPERQRFRFDGERLSAASVDARVCCGRWSAGAELARASTGGVAAVVSAYVRSSSLRARFGAGHLSRDYWTPLGGGVPGTSGGSNATSAWVSLEGRVAESFSWRAETLLRTSPWRSYHEELPDVGRRTTLGASYRIRGMGKVDVELRSQTSCPGTPGEETEIRTRRRLTLRIDGRVPLFVRATSSRTASGGVELGGATSLELRCDVPVGRRTLLSAGAASITYRGEHRSLVHYEPGLPGDLMLRSLNMSGARCYIRLRMGVSEVTSLAARLSGCPGRGEYSFGVSIDAKG